ncbi:MAG TPA: hypothetical protein VFV75_04490 [Candidatus Polarisedimenticolaceae bacterium]|nr:hypothetical protein [Candidatus Polarisedimenticolaceae bacterium]
MHMTHARRMRLLAPLALALVAGLGAFSLRAGDALSTEFADTTDPSAPSNPPLNVREANVDGNGNIKVHEQGVVQVTGTVDVGNSPKVQDVNITNDPLEVKVKTGTVHFYHHEVYPFDEDTDLTIDIHEYSRVRVQITVNGSGTVDFLYATDGGVHGEFSEDSGGFGHTLLLPEVAGTELQLFLNDPDGEQVFVNVYGTY